MSYIFLIVSSICFLIYTYEGSIDESKSLEMKQAYKALHNETAPTRDDWLRWSIVLIIIALIIKIIEWFFHSIIQ
jgi:NADH:ubiquinone oxidoreductase subunit 2 (subunit N)